MRGHSASLAHTLLYHIHSTLSPDRALHYPGLTHAVYRSKLGVKIGGGRDREELGAPEASASIESPHRLRLLGACFCRVRTPRRHPT